MSVKGAEKMTGVSEATMQCNLCERVFGRGAQDFRLVETLFDQVVDRAFPVCGEKETVERTR